MFLFFRNVEGKKSNFLLTLYKNWLSDSTIVCRFFFFFFVFYVIRANRKEQRGGGNFISKEKKRKKKIRHDQGWIFPTVESELIINLLYSVIIKDLELCKWLKKVCWLLCFKPLIEWPRSESDSNSPTFHLEKKGRFLFFSFYLPSVWRKENKKKTKKKEESESPFKIGPTPEEVTWTQMQ